MGVGPNTVKERVENGQVSVGLRNGFFHTPAIIELGGYLGMDWVRMEYEPRGPSPSNTQVLENYARAADAAGTEVMLRFHQDVGTNAMRNAVKAGIRNFKITMVESADEIERLVDAVKYNRDGEAANRGVANTRSNHYGQIPLDLEHLEHEDDNVFVGITIESEKAIDNLDEIFSVPEIGHVNLGVGDLANSLGHPGDREHPDVVEAKKEFISKVEEYDIPMYVDLHDDVEAQQVVDKGLGYAQDKIDLEHHNPLLLGISRPQTDIVTTVNERYDALVDAGHIEDNRD